MIEAELSEQRFEAGLLDYWYAVSVHPYRQTDPETAAFEYCRLRQTIQAYRLRSGSNRVIPIISGAGGIITTWAGDPAEHGGRIVAAGDRGIHDAALAMLKG